VFKSVSVIIPVRNRETLIGPCLEHLFKAAVPVVEQGTALEIVIADDASTDRSRDVVAAMRDRSPVPVKHVLLETRQGPARARNAALREASGELVVFVDSDVIVESGFFEAHLAVYRDAGREAFAVGTLVSVPSLEAALARPKPTKWDYSGATLDTANASVPWQALEAVGFFDPGFEGMGWQDLDLGRRLKAHGLTRVKAKNAVAYHIQPPIRTQEQLRARLQKERERGASALRYMQKHPTLSAKLAAQDTRLHVFLNWLFRMGGLVHEGNVLDWVEWARRRGFVALEKMWLLGVINKAHLESLAAAKRAASRPSPPPSE